MSNDDKIKITGLIEFQKQLRQIDREFPISLRKAFNKAVEIIADDAKSRVPSKSGKAKASIRPKSTQRAAQVSGGGKKVPYFGFLEFGNLVNSGGGVGRGDSIARSRGGKDGRYIYPAYHKHKDEVIEGVTEALTDVARKAGLDPKD